MRTLFLILILSLTVFAQGDKLSTVENVDLNRYQGKWYEIARFPNRFQKKCIGNTTATYTIKKPGIVEVVNVCKTKKGKMDRAVGKAKVVNSDTNAQLKVRFAPRWIGWLPFVWGDYWIIDLDEKDYSYAVVGDPSRKYLWILSRQPRIEEKVYSGIIERINEKGFDSSKLITTSHSE